MALRHPSVLTALLALAACLPASRQADPWEAAPAGRVAQVAVQNHGDQDMNVYVSVRGSGRRRIGTVMRVSTGKLVIPADVLAGGSAELVAVPVGGGVGSALSCPRIEAGAHILLVLEQQPVLSTCTWNRSRP